MSVPRSGSSGSSKTPAWLPPPSTYQPYPLYAASPIFQWQPETVYVPRFAPAEYRPPPFAHRYEPPQPAYSPGFIYPQPRAIPPFDSSPKTAPWPRDTTWEVPPPALPPTWAYSDRPVWEELGPSSHDNRWSVPVPPLGLVNPPVPSLPGPSSLGGFAEPPSSHDGLQDESEGSLDSSHDPKKRKQRRRNGESPRDLAPRRYQCELCIEEPRSFARPSALKIHMLTHTKEKPHVCPVCSRAFAIASNLKRHQRLHENGEQEVSTPSTTERWSAPVLGVDAALQWDPAEGDRHASY